MRRALTEATTSAVLEDARLIVRRGGVIAVPTESFYALGADPLNEEAVQRVCELKGRPLGQPILVLLASRDDVRQFARDLPEVAVTLMARFWPGPLTIVLPAAASLPRSLTAGTGTIGVRVPAHQWVNKILAVTGPLTGTSANRSGAAPVCTAHEVEVAFGSACELVLDAGRTSGGPPSTVVDVANGVHVIREGAISRLQLAKVVGERALVG
jgi:L-threonylcarbamoyladenylate synthase